ncbi:Gfo/Idh/MocA family oxidoreductase [Bacillaceae bacterium SIJ1]|uniref:Gfo/Idh/MocA family protein n=1 Tax=Litoribacterium kuwaitense TaxID=1398745 RepID=UPI0013EDD71C|nr:Gfo/Idh/MocA family oxidoreductase [Litoribacterium kuwaitense]NGP45941.1 Gfo/Idh/MocA family oxidoreductase [Litoribacterium kuwaitense]
MSKVKVGFIGVGGIASVHLKNISDNENAEIVAVCDISEENVQRASSQYGAPAYTDSKQMIEEIDMDALYLCVPPFAHGTLEEDAVAKGIHLLVEKPVELDVAKAAKKGEAIKEAGIINASGYCLRYLDTVQKAKEYLEGKEIGMVRGYYLSAFVPTPWFREMDKSGGQLVEQATHTLDLMRYFAGDITDVYANMNLSLLKDIPNITIPDVTSVNCVFESGVVGHLDCSNTQPDHRSGLEILGRDFRVHIDGTDLEIVEKGKVTRYKATVNFMAEEDKQFIEAVRTKDQSLILSCYQNGLETLTATMAANESNETKAPVKISEFAKSTT